MEVRKSPHRTLVLHDKQNTSIEQQCMTPVPYLCCPSCRKPYLSVLRTWGGGTCTAPGAIATGVASHPGLSEATGCCLLGIPTVTQTASVLLELKTILSLKNRKKPLLILSKNLGSGLFQAVPEHLGAHGTGI